MKTCPMCAEAIQPAAVICRHCGSDVARRRGPSWALVAGLGGLALAIWFAAPAGADGRSARAASAVISTADDGCPGTAALPPGHPPIGELPPGHPPLESGPRLPPGHPPVDGAPALPSGKVPVTPIPKAKPFLPPDSTIAL